LFAEIFNDRPEPKKGLLKSPHKMMKWMSDLEGKMGVLHTKMKDMQDNPVVHSHHTPQGLIHKGHYAKKVTASQKSEENEIISNRHSPALIETVSDSGETKRSVLKSSKKMRLWVNDLEGKMGALHDQVKVMQDLPHVLSPPTKVKTPSVDPIPAPSPPTARTPVPPAKVQAKKSGRSQMKGAIAKMRAQLMAQAPSMSPSSESLQGPIPAAAGPFSAGLNPSRPKQMKKKQPRVGAEKTKAEKSKKIVKAPVREVKDPEVQQEELRVLRENQRKDFKSFVKSKRAQKPAAIDFDLEVAYIPKCPTQRDTGCTTPGTVVSDLVHTLPVSTVIKASAKVLLVKEELKGQDEDGEGTSVEQSTDSGKDSQATVKTPHSDSNHQSSMTDFKAVTRAGCRPQRDNDLAFEGLGVEVGTEESKQGHPDNFHDEGEGEDNEEDWEEESLDPSMFLSPFIFSEKKDAASDGKEVKDASENKQHESSEIEAAYLALYAHMESVSTGANLISACEDVTFGDEEVPEGEDEEEGEEIEETGEGIVQWIDVGDDVEVDEDEESDSSGEGTPADTILSTLDLETLSVRLSSRSEDDKTHSRNNQMILDEIPLFYPSKREASSRSALDSVDRDDKNDKDDVITGISLESPLKRVWVPKTVDFALVVENLQVALTAEELRTINWKKTLRKTSRKVAEADILRRSLQVSLGVEAFNDASNFLRTVATMQIEDSNTEDDEYLLSQMEEIVGAEGLQYMEEIFTLITMEDDIERDEIDASEIEQKQEHEQKNKNKNKNKDKHKVDQKN
jgi:hypothetical protein